MMAASQRAARPADERYDVEELTARCTSLLAAAGARQDIARTVAEVLVEGEMLGQETHGVGLLERYVQELVSARMTGDAEWVIEKDTAASQLWDGCYLPGPWLVRNAIDAATSKARQGGVGTISIGNSHHIGCLAAYLYRPASAGLLVIVQSSDPSAAGVAPFGGTKAVISPNPIAAGVPANPQPFLIDVSTSITTFGRAKRCAAAGERLPGAWLLDARGNPTDDPSVLATTPQGSLLPLGGQDSGHKGFGLGILVDVLTGALSGRGRAGEPSRWGASVLVTVIDPEAFCGLSRFVEETSHLGALCRTSPAIDPGNPVRMPGERGLARRTDALSNGLHLSPAAADSLVRVGQRFGLHA